MSMRETERYIEHDMTSRCDCGFFVCRDGKRKPCMSFRLAISGIGDI